MPFWTILVILIILTILVEIMTFVHELGHFMVAKFNKATVVEFAIGFGPALYQKRIGDTTYSFRALPFGGYVAVLSDEIIVGLEKLKKMDLTPQQAVNLKKQLKGFDEKTDWSEKPTIDKVSAPRKVWFALMGVTMNFFMLWALLFVTYASAGKKEDYNQMYFYPVFANLNEVTSTPASQPEASDTTYEVKMTTTSIYGEFAYSITDQVVNEDINNGEDYYKAMQKEIEDTDWTEQEQNYNEKNLTNAHYMEMPEELTLTYTESDAIKDYKGTDWIENTEYTFNYLVQEKVNDENHYYLIDAGSKHTYPEPGSTSISNETINPQINFPPDKETKSEVIEKTLAIPLAKENSAGEFVSYNEKDILSKNSFNPLFGVVDNYKTMPFGESIWRSLVDSFIYLGKGFVMIFDVLTFGLVLNDGIPHMYANGQYVHNGNAGLWWGNLTLVMLIWMSYLMIVFNVLPFPPLDGWRVVEYSYEGIKKKKIADKTTMTMYKIGIALFFIVIIGGIIVGI